MGSFKKKPSKRQKLSTKYNIEKRVKEHHRRVRKEAKKMGLKKKPRKDPGIPNNWPFKAQLLDQMDKKREAREKDIAKRKEDARKKNKEAKEEQQAMAQQIAQDREQDKRDKKMAEVEKSQRETFTRTLNKATILLMILDARDPMGCRCKELEEWVQENKEKKLMFALTKAELVAPQVLADWMQFLGQVCPTFVVSVQGGGEGVPELMTVLGHHKGAEDGPSVGLVGYLDTGKKSLLRAMRRECKGSNRWLLDTMARLRPEKGDAGTHQKVHLAIRGASLKADTKTVPMQTIRSLIERCDANSVIRRFRMPVYKDPDDFVAAFCKDNHMKDNRGVDFAPTKTAKRILAAINKLPGIFCVPPGSPGTINSWSAHGERKAALEEMMQAQIKALQGRGHGPTTNGIRMSSNVFNGEVQFGPAVEVKKILGEMAEPKSILDTLDVEEVEDEGEEEEDDGEEGDEEMGEGEESEEDDEGGMED